jgi:quercetin dioxygenase-like cupin family protein
MEIVPFGAGHRQPHGPRGSRNVSGQAITSGAHGVITELAFARNAVLEPHATPAPSWFVVIEGGGFVRVGDEQERVAAGEAVLLPADIPHAAWTDQGHMRAIIVEFPAGAGTPRLIDRRAAPVAAATAGTSAPGRLASRANPRYDPHEGEPV